MSSTDDSEPQVPVVTVFKSPGLKPDTRLQVFDYVFHVHSPILKLYSAYFRKFLDSPDKANAPPTTSTSFRYNYVSVVDTDGFWGLEPTRKEPTLMQTQTSEEKMQYTLESLAFSNILSALYSRPYTISSVEQISLMIRQADFYCALPMVSASLSAALLASPDVLSQIPSEAPNLLLEAFKLRHPVLFRECFIHVVGMYSSLQDTKFPAVIEALIYKARSRLCEDILVVDHGLLKLLYDNNNPISKVFPVMGPYNRSGPIEQVGYYRRLLKAEKEIYRALDFKNDWKVNFLTPLSKLMKSNLVLDRSGIEAGEGIYEERFLCAEISDEDLPWDESVTDW